MRSNLNLLFIYVLCYALLSACQVDKPEEIMAAEALIPDKVSYNFHVKPILSDRCFACHGPDEDKREAGLRLDVAEAAFAELPENEGKHAIVAHDLADSEFYHRIISDDPEVQMPPPESNLSLSAEEKAILIRWIEQGADYKPHWAFAPAEKKPVPVSQSSWIKNEIDAFVLRQLEEKGLSPSAEADRETLIRRLSFDLTGLPPSLEEIDAFVADTSPEAYEKLVGRLLDSPAYGERMAAHWLDVARYADSDGYLDDKHRDFSPWRDWVIEAFNQNMPYDEFVTLQLAGDLLPNATREDILPTAFNRLHKRNTEAGIVFEEYRVEYVADRTNTLGKAFLGLSLECARCHDHKYDPVSQEDYYSMFAFFNSTFESGSPVYGPDQTPGPALLLSDEKTDAQISELRQFIYQQEESLEEDKEQKHFAQWKKAKPNLHRALAQDMQRGLQAYYPLDKFTELGNGKALTDNLVNAQKPATLKEAVIREGIQGNAFYVSDYNSIALGEKIGWFERTEPFSLDLWVYPDTVYEEAGVFTHCEDVRLGLKGYSLYLQNNKLQFIMAHSWPQNAIELTSREALPAKAWSRITITYDGSSRAEGIRLYLNGKEAARDVVTDNLYKGILYEPNIHTYAFRGFHLGSRDKITPMKEGGLDEIRIYERELTALEVSYLSHPEQTKEALKQGTVTEQALAEYYFARHKDAPQVEELQQARNELNALMNSIPEIMVMGDLPKPRPTYLLERGSYSQPGKEVLPDTPDKIFSFPDSLPRNRLGLAKWMFAPDHPLTARVIVNRIWQLHFGKGLVKTSDDLGNQGDLPSHPELLDYLAIWLQEHEWDLKALHKLIVMSATYQQSSQVTPELLEQDPENQYLARAPRFRLPAEMIRDNALAVSGLLVEETGGESVYPYQPEGLWDELSNKSWRYPYLQTEGEGLYRRSIYTIWKRTSPPPSMLIFDMPQRGECKVRRTTTSTPLQALVLLNDPQFVEASRVLAEKVLQMDNSSLEDKLEKTFRLLTGRKPQSKETLLLQAHYKDEYDKFSKHPEDLQAYLSIGAQEVKAEQQTELAALAVVANSIMNTNEAYTRK
ncbi:hypothetical protein OKW21_003858 [Catalinimonas alkaloidigena]|uniref:DUF1553 domain-containing protein n=1 Tax=Catalinimonas alkaloidigena TaxID=1075417 RepID=UPI0024060251|nr:DUF1553 domain-containing protein [Catalinimonas alkaloidigena]MDF9798595.1 hypothetical protein [Catalinimonas alkaloidigena]